MLFLAYFLVEISESWGCVTDPLFTGGQLNKTSKEDIISLMKTMWEHYQKQEAKIQILKEETKELKFLNVVLSDRLTPAQRKQFDPSSEKYADSHTQLNLSSEAKREMDPDAPEPGMEEIHLSSYKKRRRSDKKEKDLSAFEITEVIEYELANADRDCPDCSTKCKVVTKETVKCLKFVPARFEVAEGVTYVYGCPKCGTMKRPERAPSLLKGGVATPSLAAGIMNVKYVGGMPLARQGRKFARYNLNLSTKTMASWVIQYVDRYLQPLYELMKEEFLRSRYAHGNETRVQVIDEPEQKGSTQNQMWVYLTDEYSGSPRVVLFQYERVRAGYHPVESLRDQFRGYFTCDGYQAHHSLPERIAVTGCMTHTRRRFDELVTVSKRGFTKEQLKETTAYQAMAWIEMSYKIEEMIRDKSPEERCGERQKQAKSLLEAFFGWPHTLEEAVGRSSRIEEAVLYTLNQETYLKRYLEDGHLSIDNLVAERALKNFTIGRRSWLFAKNIRGARVSATMYSITGTALLNGLKPYNYLTYVTEEMKDLGTFPAKEEMLELLPWSSNLPDDCRSKLKE